MRWLDTALALATSGARREPDVRVGVPETVDSDGPIVLRTDQARQAVLRGIAALDAGEIEDAEAAAVAALRADPGFHGGVHLLARVLEHLGHEREADAAWKDVLSVDTLDRYFPTDRPRRIVEEPPGTWTIDGSAPARIEVPRALASRGTPLPALLASIDTRGTHVGFVEGGRLWHDAASTLVLDARGDEIGRYSRRNAPLVARLCEHREPMHHAGRLILLGAPGSGNYYHWMVDILPKLALLEAAGVVLGPADKLVLPLSKGRFQRETLALAGIAESSVLFCTDVSPWLAADELVIPWIDNAMGHRMEPEVPAMLRSLFDGAMPKNDGPRRRIYIDRDASAAQGRSVTNRVAVAEVLDEYRVETVFPERLSVVEQAALFASADLVVAPHGAGLTNLVFCRAGTSVIECVGSHYRPCYQAISAVSGLRYHIVVADPGLEHGTPDEPRTRKRRQTADLTIDCEALADRLAHVDDGGASSRKAHCI